MVEVYIYRFHVEAGMGGVMQEEARRGRVVGGGGGCAVRGEIITE